MNRKELELLNGVARPAFAFTSLGLKTSREDDALGERGWKHYAFSCTISSTHPNGVRSESFEYRMGTGLGKVVHANPLVKGERIYNHFGPGRDGVRLAPAPTLADVLSCLIMESRDIDSTRDFEGWCAMYGLDDDSRKAERTYKDACRNARMLRHVLGTRLYDSLAELDDDDIAAWCENRPMQNALGGCEDEIVAQCAWCGGMKVDGVCRSVWSEHCATVGGVA